MRAWLSKNLSRLTTAVCLGAACSLDEWALAGILVLVVSVSSYFEGHDRGYEIGLGHAEEDAKRSERRA